MSHAFHCYHFDFRKRGGAGCQSRGVSEMFGAAPSFAQCLSPTSYVIPWKDMPPRSVAVMRVDSTGYRGRDESRRKGEKCELRTRKLQSFTSMHQTCHDHLLNFFSRKGIVDCNIIGSARPSLEVPGAGNEIYGSCVLNKRGCVRAYVCVRACVRRSM